MNPEVIVRTSCGLLAIWDLGLGLLSLLFPRILHDLMQPGVPLEGAWWIQRTAWVWLAFALAQAMAWRTPSAEKARLVAFMRASDTPADLTWWFTAPGLGRLGSVVLVVFPLINLVIAVTLWKAAGSLDRAMTPAAPGVTRAS